MTSLSHAVAAEIQAQRARGRVGGDRVLSETAIGEAIGRSQSYVNRRMRGVEPWELDDLEALAPLLGTTVRDIIVRASRSPDYDVDESPALDVIDE